MLIDKSQKASRKRPCPQSFSVTVITLNEEANIVPCLESASWAAEIVVLDSGSTDRTVELARQFTDRVLSVPWQGFGKTKNQAVAEARMPWIFVLDADEQITPPLRREIEHILQADGPWTATASPAVTIFAAAS